MNRKTFLSVTAFLCTFCILSVGTASAAGSSAPALRDENDNAVQTILDDDTELEAAAKEKYYNGEPLKELTGTVVEVANNQIIVKDGNGNTIVFTMTYIQDTDAKAGDKVTLSYCGDVLDCPEVVDIVINDSVVVPSITGTVIRIFSNEIFVEVQSSQVFGFYFFKDSAVVEGVPELAVGDYGTVYYSGSLIEEPTAYKVEVSKAASDRSETDSTADDVSTENKHLTGIVTSLSSSSISILTSKNRQWTFRRSSASKISGKYTLETGATVRITYDGYASSHPLAKQIKVTAAPDPTPKTHKTSGVVQSFGGMELYLESGFHCDCAYAKISGGGNREPGDLATVTYYTKDGENYATKIVFDMLVK